MAWTRRATGTASNGNNTTSLTPGLPSGWQAGDLHLCHFQNFGGTNSRTPSMDSNWTQIAVWQNGTTSHGLWYRIAVGGDTAPTVTLTGTGATNDTQLSQIHGFYPGSGKTAKIDVTGSTSTNASADDVGPITGITATAGTLGIISCGKANDWNGAPTLTSWTASVNTAANESTTGSDAAQALMYVLSIGGGATGNLTVVDNGGTASAGVGLGIIVTFKEIIVKATGVAEETDTALQSGRAKATGLAEETDSAQTLAAARLKATGVATETDTAEAPTVTLVANPGLYLPLGFYWASREPTLVATGIAEETDSSPNLGRIKFYATGVASETDSAITVAICEAVSTGIANETDSSETLARTKIKSYLESNETDTSLAVAAARLKATGFALETDSSETLSRVKLRSVDFASETDTAEALTRVEGLTVGFATETDSAETLSRIKIRTAGIAEETDTPLTLDLVVGLATGVSTEIDTSIDLTRSKLYTYSTSNETDSSYAVGRIKIKAAGLSEETDSALAPTVSTVTAIPGFYFPLRFNFGALFVQPPVGYAVETDTALGLVRTKFYNVQTAVEVDTALNLGTGDPGFWLPLRFYVGVPGGAKLVTVGRAEEVDTALSRTLVRSPLKLMVRWAQETPIASKLTYIKGKTVGIATSVNTSVTTPIARTKPAGIANETDTAFGPPFGIVGQVGVATEVDYAIALIRVQAVTVKVANETDNAIALIAPMTVDVGVAVETDTALELETNFARAVSPAIELDEALSRNILHTVSVKTAISTNEAVRLARIRVVDTKLAQSFNTAFQVVRTKKKSTGVAVEVDAARGMLVRSYAAREYDNAAFLEIKQNGVVIFPVVSTTGDRRMWTGFIS